MGRGCSLWRRFIVFKLARRRPLDLQRRSRNRADFFRTEIQLQGRKVRRRKSDDDMGGLRARREGGRPPSNRNCRGDHFPAAAEIWNFHCLSVAIRGDGRPECSIIASVNWRCLHGIEIGGPGLASCHIHTETAREGGPLSVMMTIPRPFLARRRENQRLQWDSESRACMSSDMQSEPTKKEAIFHTDDETLSDVAADNLLYRMFHLIVH